MRQAHAIGQGRVSELLLLSLSAGLLWLWGATAGALPVIPSASGFGMDTPAGRGGTVHRVTNLSDSGVGSLRACIDANGPRVCVFEVSGVIRLASPLTIYNPRITIAGQTAPSPGIMLRGSTLRIHTQDVLLQHLTIRMGDDLNGSSGKGLDAFTINYWQGAASNVVIDHCSLSWGTDETFSIWHGFRDITISNTIFSEGLNYSPVFSNGGFGVLTGPVATGRLAFVNNYFAHNVERNPLSKTGELVLVNNVIYNWAKDATRFANEADNQLGGDLVRTKNSVVGNLYIRGPSYRLISGAQSKPIWFDSSMAASGNHAYFADNAEIASTSHAPVPPSDQWTLVNISSPNSRSSLEVSAPPTWVPGLVAKPVGQVKSHIIKNVGARPGDRSRKDVQMIADLQNGTGTYVSCVNPSSYYTAGGYIADSVANCDKRNAGGWPVYAENRRSLVLPSNPHGDDNGNGYTNLEEWLHGYAAAVEGRTQDTSPQAPKIMSVQ